VISTGVDLDDFIARRVTGRASSLFAADLAAAAPLLRERIEGRSVLVIGGAGTIGSSYIRALLPFRPARLVVVDTSENGLTELTRDLRSDADTVVPDAYTTYPVDFGSPTFARLFRTEGPFDIVAHFAAHKHVRSEKDRFSIEAMVGNNVLSTVRLLELLAGAPPERFFCVSTDKAANPANVMGASKKLMEEAVLAYAGAGVVPATTARFANVAFSNGSLPAGFLERLAKRQPLSAPSDVRRYFVSPAESGELCLASCMLGEPGDILFPRLAEPEMLTFAAIAEALLDELGFVPERYEHEADARRAAATMAPGDRTWPVHFFASDTSGEKPAEEFHTDDEVLDLDRFGAIGVVRGRTERTVDDIRGICDDLAALFERDVLEKADIVAVLARLVPTFSHVETGRGLDQRM